MFPRTLAASWKTIVSPYENGLLTIGVDINGTNRDVLGVAVSIKFS